MTTNPRIRDGRAADAAACAAIYAPYVLDIAVTFETEPPGPAEMAERIATATRSHAWLVLEAEDRIVGYAYGGPFKARAAYRWSCEVSVYLEHGRVRTGRRSCAVRRVADPVGRSWYRTAVAGMTLPNEASVGLHRAMGFELVGVNTRIGWKLDRWHDVAWMQRSLGPSDDPPLDLR